MAAKKQSNNMPSATPNDKQKQAVDIQNLRFLERMHNLKECGLAEALGIKRHTINAILGGRQKIQPDDLQKICAYFGISAQQFQHSVLSEQFRQWLEHTQQTATEPTPPTDHRHYLVDNLLHLVDHWLSQHGQHYYQFIEHLKGNDLNVRTLALTTNLQNESNIELVSIKAAAGYAVSHGDPEFLEELTRFYLPFLPNNATHRAFEVRGDSMLPVEEGDIIVGEFVRDLTEIKNDQTYIVVLRDGGDQSVLYKRVRLQKQDHFEVQLLSDNEQYLPQPVHKSRIAEMWRERACIHRRR